MKTEEKLYTVYRLENVVTKKNYIGMTGDAPRKRWGYGYHGKMGDAIKNYPFDLCWKKYIEFQTPNKEQALELESELMKWYDSVDNGYNTSSYGNSHCKHSEETKQKISEAHVGKHHSEETRQKLSKAMTGEKHPMFGKHLSEETKKKIRENNPSKPVIQFSKKGEFIAEYPSLAEAERCVGCNHIWDCCKGKRKSTGGYIWKYA